MMGLNPPSWHANHVHTEAFLLTGVSYLIKIYHSDSLDATPDKHMCRMRTHPSQAHHDDEGFLDRRKRFLPEKRNHSGEQLMF